ncbi:MAG: hypothetical protein AB3N19_17090 [Ruegeria sp.]
MIAGLVLSGLLVGALAGAIGFAAGMSGWVIFMLYSLLGATAVLAGAMVVSYRSDDQRAPGGSFPLARPDA